MIKKRKNKHKPGNVFSEMKGKKTVSFYELSPGRVIYATEKDIQDLTYLDSLISEVEERFGESTTSSLAAEWCKITTKYVVKKHDTNSRKLPS